MKQTIKLLTVAGLLAATGCSNGNSTTTTTTPTSSSSSQASNTYHVTASGYGGEMNIDVTIEGDKITDIALGENHETNVVIDRAFPVIRDRILEANSPAVDSVSAATFSSYAVKQAVADAMSQAGLTVEGEVTRDASKFSENPTKVDDVTTDIVVVGGGPSGLAAAITAKQENPEVNVTVIEKLDILSGNGKFDMNFYDVINSEAQIANNNIITVDDFIEMKSNTGETTERIAKWAESEYTVDAWLRDMGVELNDNYGGTNHMAETDQYAGEVIQAGLERTANELGITILTGTKGMDLVMEDGAVKGVVVTNTKGETYNVLAKKTIIATGGFCTSKELLAEYAPGYEKLNTSNQMGTTGDFVKVFEKYDMQLDHMDNVRVFENIINPRRDLTGGADLNLLVNKNGELLNDNAAGLERGEMVLSQPDGAAYYITDKTGYDSFYRIRKHVDAGYYATGETIEELAEKLGIDASGLATTVEEFNTYAANGEENPVLGDVSSRTLDAEGPYYGVRVEPADHMTKGGVVANENGQVLYEDGTVVEGLYAVGEVTWQSGGYSQSVCFGRIAGQHAVETINE